jgi:hypothetical protein
MKENSRASMTCLISFSNTPSVWADDKWLQEHAGKNEEDEATNATDFTNKMRENATGEKTEAAVGVKRDAPEAEVFVLTISCVVLSSISCSYV